MPPAFRTAQQPIIQRTQASSHLCQKRSVSPLRLRPVIDDGRFRRFRPRPGRQVIRFFFDRTRKEPEILFLSQLLCRFIKKFLQDSSRMKRNPTRYFTFRFQF